MSAWSYALATLKGAWRFLQKPMFGFLTLLHAIEVAIWAGVFTTLFPRLLAGSGDMVDLIFVTYGAAFLAVTFHKDAYDYHLKNTHGVDPRLLCKNRMKLDYTEDGEMEGEQ